MGLLVHSEHRGVGQRTQTQPDHISDLVDQLWVGGNLEARCPRRKPERSIPAAQCGIRAPSPPTKTATTKNSAIVELLKGISGAWIKKLDPFVYGPDGDAPDAPDGDAPVGDGSDGDGSVVEGLDVDGLVVDGLVVDGVDVTAGVGVDVTVGVVAVGPGAGWGPGELWVRASGIPTAAATTIRAAMPTISHRTRRFRRG